VQAVVFHTPNCCLDALSPVTAISRKQSKFTPAHDAAAAALSRRQSIHIDAGPIKLVYALHLRLAAQLILDKTLFSPWI